LKVCETSGVATTTGKIESNFWDRGKRFLAIEPLVNCIARTGLLLAGSAGFLVATCFSKFVVAGLHCMPDVLGLHHLTPFVVKAMPTKTAELFIIVKCFFYILKFPNITG
jgi:hypothetical protein